MNDACFKLAEGLVPTTYARQAQQARRARESLVKSLLAQRRLPEHGVDDGTLQLLLHEACTARTRGRARAAHSLAGRNAQRVARRDSSR